MSDREFEMETRTCAKPGCGETFRCGVNSAQRYHSTYCQRDDQGRGPESWHYQHGARKRAPEKTQEKPKMEKNEKRRPGRPRTKKPEVDVEQSRPINFPCVKEPLLEMAPSPAAPVPPPRVLETHEVIDLATESARNAFVETVRAHAETAARAEDYATASELFRICASPGLLDYREKPETLSG